MVKIIVLYFLFSSLLGSGQEQTKVLYGDSTVRIESILQDCERKDRGTHIQYYYINIVNLTNQNISVSFKREMWYNGQCISCDKESSEYLFTDTLLANETKQGDCYQNTARQYRIFSKMLNFKSNSVLTNFSISNIKVEKL